MSRLRGAQAIAISSFCLCCWLTSAHSDGQLARTIIGDFTETRLSVIDVAARLTRSRIPVGVEAVNGPEGHAVDLALKDATVADVLNAAVRADPRYQWKEDEGVINLFPKEDGDPVFGVVIDHFEARNEMAVQMINQLLSVPKVKKYLDDRKVRAGILTSGPFLVTPGHRTQIVNFVAIENETLRQALNHVLVKTQSVYWSAGRDDHDGKKYLWFQVW
jgi:hypothetical protein